MDRLFDSLTLLSGASGVAVIISFLIGWFRQRQTDETAEEATNESKREGVLDAADLHVLGSYVFDEIGAIPVSSYVSKVDLRKRVDDALDLVSKYVEKEELTGLDEPARVMRDFPRGVQLPASLVRAHEEIQEGSVWNGLAILRREIELALRARAQLSPSAKTVGAGSILRDLVRRELIDSSVANQLGYAISVANSAIHGEEISVGQADEAWQAGVLGLGALLRPQGNERS